MSSSPKLLPVNFSGSGRDERFGYLPCLDGLRAISILMVLGLHEMGAVSNKLAKIFTGWAGVDIFFVISGFLITSLLLQERADRGAFSLKHFYVRRTLRIWPAFYCYLLAMGATGFNNWSQVFFGGIYLTNYDLAFGWDRTNAPHLWSLALEEQFYLVWPVVLYFAGRRALPVAVGMVLATWVWRTFLLYRGSEWLRLTAAFDTRLDCPMIGCLAALLWADPEWRNRIRSGLAGRWVPLLAATALFSIVQTLGHPSDAPFEKRLLLWAYRLPLFSILTAVFILAMLVNPLSPVTRLLARPVPVLLGRLSYSIYLWHGLAFISWARLSARLPGTAWQKSGVQELGHFGMTLLFAAMSYYLIERPVLILKRRWEEARRAREWKEVTDESVNRKAA